MKGCFQGGTNDETLLSYAFFGYKLISSFTLLIYDFFYLVTRVAERYGLEELSRSQVDGGRVVR